MTKGASIDGSSHHLSCLGEADPSYACLWSWLLINLGQAQSLLHAGGQKPWSIARPPSLVWLFKGCQLRGSCHQFFNSDAGLMLCSADGCLDGGLGLEPLVPEASTALAAAAYFKLRR